MCCPLTHLLNLFSNSDHWLGTTQGFTRSGSIFCAKFFFSLLQQTQDFDRLQYSYGWVHSIWVLWGAGTFTCCSVGHGPFDANRWSSQAAADVRPDPCMDWEFGVHGKVLANLSGPCLARQFAVASEIASYCLPMSAFRVYSLWDNGTVIGIVIVIIVIQLHRTGS